MQNLLFESGILIKKLREAKGLTQAQLCNATNKACSIKTLSRIENGKHTPNAYILEKLLIALGFDLINLLSHANDRHYPLFDSDFEQIWDNCVVQRIEQAITLFKELKTKPYFDITNPLTAQAAFLFEGQISESYTLLCYALKLTNKSIFTAQDTLDCKKITEQTFSVNEYRIIKLMTVTKTNNKDLLTSVAICQALVMSLADKKTDYTVRKKVLPEVLLNLSTLLIELHMYEETLTISNNGLQFCIQVGAFVLFGDFLYNKGISMHKLGYKQEATVILQKAHDIFLDQGRIAQLRRCQNFDTKNKNRV